MDGISKLLSNDGFITVNKTLIRELGLHESIIIGELCSEYNYWEKCNKLEDGMFYSTRDNIEYNTGLNDHYQRKALKTLQDAGIIEIVKKGIPAVNYYKINFDKILNTLSTSCSSREALDVNAVDLNNNKQTEIKKQKNNSKELLQNQKFQFGKQKQGKESLYTKCANLIRAKSDDNDIQKLLFSWLDMLLEKYKYRNKALYVNVFKGKLNMLDKFDTKDWKEIIEYNLQKGYEGFYPLPVSNYSTNIKDKPWEIGVSSAGYTDEEKRQNEKEREEMIARGERVWF